MRLFVQQHEITLKKPDDPSIDYHDYARAVADGLDEHLSKLPNIVRDSLKVRLSVQH
jgi:hypothetical protein